MVIQGLTPTVSAPLIGQTASADPSTGASGSNTSSSSLETTFLNLLATELQNQDPTSPVDPTAMVGQMVSLNQLDQLISINQLLQQSVGSGSGTTPPATGGIQVAARSNLQPTPLGPTSAPVQGTGIAPQPSITPQSVTSAYPNGASLMNLYGSLASASPSSMLTTSGGK
jgi:flagellar basal-body rod modification protein FlgD